MQQPIVERADIKGRTERRSRRLVRQVSATVAILVAVTILGLYGSTVYLIQKTFSHRVEKLEHVPEDFGLQAETVGLTSSDGISLKGWWVPVDSARGAVLVLHGMDGLDASCLLHMRSSCMTRSGPPLCLTCGHMAGVADTALDFRLRSRETSARP